MKRLFRMLAGALAMAVCLSLIHPALAQEDASTDSIKVHVGPEDVKVSVHKDAAKDSTAHKRARRRMGHGHGHMDHMGRKGHSLERMTEHLDLTEEQAASVETILEEHKQSMEELAERHKALHDELMNALGETLDEERMETLKEHMSGQKNSREKSVKKKRGGDRERGKRMRGKREKGRQR